MVSTLMTPRSSFLHTNGAHMSERMERSTMDCRDANLPSFCASDERIDCFFSTTALMMVRLTGNSPWLRPGSLVRPSAGARPPPFLSRSMMKARSACGNMSKMLLMIFSSRAPGFSRAPRSCDTLTIACSLRTASMSSFCETFFSLRTSSAESDASMVALTE